MIFKKLCVQMNIKKKERSELYLHFKRKQKETKTNASNQLKCSKTNYNFSSNFLDAMVANVN